VTHRIQRKNRLKTVGPSLLTCARDPKQAKKKKRELVGKFVHCGRHSQSHTHTQNPYNQFQRSF